MGLAQAQTDVVDAFRGVSVSADNIDAYPLRAVSDPQDIQTPTVWVPLPDTEFLYSKRCLVATWTAYLIGPNSPKQRTTTEHLSAMIDAVTGLFPFTSGEVYSLSLPGGVSAQAYKLTWNSRIPIGD